MFKASRAAFMSQKDAIRIVLVGTQHPGNIGSAARAMKTMGLANLVLVAPKRFPDPEALALAAGAADILEQAQVVSTVQEALAGCTYVLGTSSRERAVLLPELSPRQAARELVDKSTSSPVALLFGPERTGLENEALQLCHARVFIPCNPQYPSLNLASAVQVLSYEIRLQRLEREENPEPVVGKEQEPPASFEQLERLFAHLAEFMQEVDFHKGKSPDLVIQRIRRLFLKANMDEREIKILRGLLTDAQRLLRQKM
jgi:tRNA (cytidine32/uridine32-2'-O)-methyltransferase